MHTMSRPSIVLIFLATMVALSCSSKKKEPVGGRTRVQGPVTADAFRVAVSSISDHIEVPGSLLPFEETHIRAEVGGRVVVLNINEGAVVSKGTLLVKLFDRDLQAQVKKLQVQLKIKEKTE